MTPTDPQQSRFIPTLTEVVHLDSALAAQDAMPKPAACPPAPDDALRQQIEQAVEQALQARLPALRAAVLVEVLANIPAPPESP